MPIYTLGHSNRNFDAFLALLEEHAIARLADVRRYPSSRRNPHFSRESLRRSLPIEYVHFEDLGGFRATDPGENALHAYAQYMTTAAFAEAVDRLLDSEKRTAVMCAEAAPSDCHRNLLADALVRRGVEVIHILGLGKVMRHGDNDQKSLDFRGL